MGRIIDSRVLDDNYRVEDAYLQSVFTLLKIFFLTNSRKKFVYKVWGLSINNFGGNEKILER